MPVQIPIYSTHPQDENIYNDILQNGEFFNCIAEAYETYPDLFLYCRDKNLEEISDAVNNFFTA